MSTFQNLVLGGMFTVSGLVATAFPETLDVVYTGHSPKQVISNFKNGNSLLVRYIRGESTLPSPYGQGALPLAQAGGAILTAGGIITVGLVLGQYDKVLRGNLQ